MKVNCLNDSFSDLSIVTLDLAITLKRPCTTLDDLETLFFGFIITFYLINTNKRSMNMKVNCLNDSFSDLAIVALDLAMTLK